MKLEGKHFTLEPWITFLFPNAIAVYLGLADPLSSPEPLK